MSRTQTLVFVLFFLALSFHGCGRLLVDNLPESVVSDGVTSIQKLPFISLINNLISFDGSCDDTYGFLPCSTTVLGNVFLILVYVGLMYFSAKLLSDGSEILLQILGPGIIGGLFLPLLSSLPDAAIILASGLSGSKTTAQSQVSVGMGLMAGSNVFLLTILWGTCVIVGKCDIEGSKAIDLKDTKIFSLTGSGVTTDIRTSHAARIMIFSIIPFVIVQLPQVFWTSLSHVAVLIALVVSISLFLCYSLYQILQPWIQKRRIAYAKHKRLVLMKLKERALGRLCKDNGQPNKDTIQKLFKAADENADGYLSAGELRALAIGIQFDEIDLNVEDAVNQLLKDFDTSGDSRIDMNEFILGISRWIEEAKHSTKQSNIHKVGTAGLLSNFDQQTKIEEDELDDQNDEADATDSHENPKWNVIKAVLMLVFGTIFSAVIADPLVDAVDDFSSASHIPSFFVSFVILPFASSSEAVSDLIFARRKNLKSASLTFSEIYGSVTMSNVLSLSVFLALVYFRDLTWDFSAEVVVIVIVCIVKGLIASVRTTYPIWMSLLAYALYPFSLALAYVLEYVLGWS